jgi:hypothetical protein
VTNLLQACGLLVVFCLGPWIGLVATAGRPVAAAAWAGVIALQQAVWWRMYRVLRLRPIWSLSFPIGAVAALGVLAHAILKALGATTTTWRGTTYGGAFNRATRRSSTRLRSQSS